MTCLVVVLGLERDYVRRKPLSWDFIIVQYSTVQYSTVSTVQYSTVQYSTVQYSTVF